jgi:hypothetical protein
MHICIAPKSRQNDDGASRCENAQRNVTMASDDNDVENVAVDDAAVATAFPEEGLYLVTMHSYGRQGCNDSGPEFISRSLSACVAHVVAKIRRCFVEEQEAPVSDKDFEFPDATEHTQSTEHFTFVQSYTTYPGDDHYAYDYEDPLYTIWRCNGV